MRQVEKQLSATALSKANFHPIKLSRATRLCRGSSAVRRGLVLVLLLLLSGECPVSVAQKTGGDAVPTIASAGEDFAVRGLEIHSSRMWRWKSVENAFGVMEKLGMNTLIFHESDLTDQLVLPRAYFSSDLMWQRWPVRLHLVLDNNRQYIRKVAREARRRNIKFFLEVKEIWYPDGLLELHPELIRSNGVVCATDPFWWEFVRKKYEELVEDIPDIAGVIVSPASRESRVSMVANPCKCERCQAYDPKLWYENLFRAMYEPLHAKGKILVVRDFSYRREQQNMVIDSTSCVANDIVIALKNTPHDFYPTFPNNPRIGLTGEHPQWVEFDTWGQFVGSGFFPCSLIEDMQRRLEYCHRNGVSGVWFRTDWENMNEASVFNSPNLLNLFGGGMLSRDRAQPLENVYRAWLEYGLLDPLIPESAQGAPVPVNPAQMEHFQKFMQASWKVIEKTLFVRGHLFHENGMFPDSVKHAFDMMTQIHGRDDWEPGASKRVEPTDENIRAVIAEKEQAEAEVAKLPGILQIEESGLPPQMKKDLGTILDLYQWYVKGFKHCATACFLAKKAMSTRDRADVEAAMRAADNLAVYRAETARRLENTSYPHYVYEFFDVERLNRLINDIRGIAAAVHTENKPVPAVTDKSNYKIQSQLNGNVCSYEMDFE
jgi:hypothetical protein